MLFITPLRQFLTQNIDNPAHLIRYKYFPTSNRWEIMDLISGLVPMLPRMSVGVLIGMKTLVIFHLAICGEELEVRGLVLTIP